MGRDDLPAAAVISVGRAALGSLETCQYMRTVYRALWMCTDFVAARSVFAVWMEAIGLG